MNSLGQRLRFTTSDQKEVLRAAAERRMQTDLGFRIAVNDLVERIPSFMLTRMEGGFGLPVAKILRHYFLEFNDRLRRAGANSLPSSFNVVGLS
jgi:hypothetical protein